MSFITYHLGVTNICYRCAEAELKMGFLFSTQSCQYLIRICFVIHLFSFPLFAYIYFYELSCILEFVDLLMVKNESS